MGNFPGRQLVYQLGQFASCQKPTHFPHLICDPAMATSDEFSTDEARLAAFSDAYDSHGPGTELASIGSSLQLSDRQQQQLIQQWQSLTAALHQIAPVKADLSDGVMKQISQPQPTVAVQQADSAPAGSRNNRRQLAKIAALFTTSVAMLYVSLHVATHEKSLNRSAEVLASFSFDPQGWDVVVVTVSDEQADRLSRDLDGQTTSSDLKVMSVMENGPSAGESFDVVMASKETSEKLLGRLAADPVEADTEWNPMMVGEMNRDELLRRFASSMQTPTKSDVYFREVILVTSDEDAGIRVTSHPAGSVSGNQAIASADGANPAVTRGATASSHEESDQVLRQLQDNGRRPVLVVLKRRSAEHHDSQGSLQSPNPGFAVYL